MLVSLNTDVSNLYLHSFFFLIWPEVYNFIDFIKELAFEFIFFYFFCFLFS